MTIDITAQEWQRLKLVLDDALALPSQVRATFLQTQLADEPQLLVHAREFLAADALADGMFDCPFHFSQSGDAPETSTDLVGTDIGPYRIVEKIGAGGMGVVYKANRTIEDVTQVVALKILKKGMDTAAIIQRFRHERRILARLNHPHIAKLLDGGSTADHRPYLVMEFVDGQPLFEYCRDQDLDLRQRLALFRKICMAVHFAHQNLVVHRDLKPSNILITKEGEPMLLDFGIAKWLAPEEADHPQLTREGVFLMTPEYASPEQFLGEPITTATDIYVLGILFYRLIADVGPAPAGHSDWASLKGAVCDATWVKPSIRLAQAIARYAEADAAKEGEVPKRPASHHWRWVRLLRGDLDNIAGMAMNRDPARRYNSAMQFSADIDRYLQGRVVLARPETFFYLLSKLIERHRLAAGLAAVLLAVILVFSTFVLVQQRQLVEQRDLAQVKGNLSEQVTQVLTEIFSAADPYAGNLDRLTARQLLDRGVYRIVGDTSLEPKLRAELIEVLGRIHVNLGLLEEAESLLTTALESKQKLYEPHRLEANTIHEVFGFFYLENGEYPKAREHLTKALAAYESLGDSQVIPLARVKGYLGEVACMLGDYKTAIEDNQAALALVREHQPDNALAISGHLRQLAIPLYRIGQYKASIAVLDEAVAVLGEDGNWPIQTYDIKDELGIAYRKLGQFDKAEAYFKEGEAARIKAFGERSLWAAVSYNQLGWLYLIKGEYTRAEALFLNTLAIRQDLLDPDHGDIAISKNNLASAYLLTGRLDEAETIYREALEIREFHFGYCHTKYAETLSNLGQVHLSKGKLTLAEADLMEALNTRTAILEPGHADIARIQYHLGELRLAQGRNDEALAYFWSCLWDFEDLYGFDHLVVGCTLAKLGEASLALGDLAAGRWFLSQSLVSLQASIGPDHPFTADTYYLIGKAQEADADGLAAAWWYGNAFDIMKGSYGPDHPRTLAAKEALAAVCRKEKAVYSQGFVWPEELAGSEATAVDRQ